jgi:hypothetical protein
MKKHAILAAAFGGASPNLIFLAVVLTKPGAELPMGTFYLGVLLYAAMGAVMAWVWEEASLKKAFYIGLGLPAFIQANLGNISAEYAKPQPVTHASFSIFGSAYAQEAPTNIPATTTTTVRPGIIRASAVETNVTNRVLQVLPSPTLSDYNLYLYSMDGKVLGRRFIGANRTNNILVPSGAQRLVIESRQFEPVPMALPVNWTNALTSVEIKPQKRMWSGFERALGFKGIKDYEVEVFTIKPSALPKEPKRP